MVDDDAAPAPAAVRWASALVLLVPAVAVLVGGWLHRWTSEDAFINYRVVEQVLAGNGPVFNAGERVEAYTSPLWQAALVVVRVTLGQVLSMAWAAVVACLALATGAFVLGARVARVLHPGELPVPVGLVMAAALPVVWDFATSGLEVAAVWLWLAGCWALLVALARRDEAPTGPRWVGALVVLGLGPVLRPDLGLMTVAFLGTAALLVRPRWTRAAGGAAIALAVPVAYQLFRMGYFASLVPSTALAKDAGGLHAGQGVAYAVDLVATYLLWVPLAVVAAVLVHAVRTRPRRLAVATVGMLVAAGSHATYIVLIGGDYMHGRLLLPALFALALPASIGVPFTDVRRPWMPAAAVGVVFVWAAVCAGSLRYGVEVSYEVSQIADYRQVGPRPFVEPVENPVPWLTGAEIAELYDAGARGTVRLLGDEVRPDSSDHFVWVLGSIGLAGYNAGVDVHVVDIGGLAEPLAARTDIVPGRPAGHRKQVDLSWYTARFGVVAIEPDPDRVAAAERALGCAPLADLLAAITEPMTPARFLENLTASVRLTSLHVAADPLEAEAELCGT